MDVMRRWNQAWDNSSIRLRYDQACHEYVAADPISEDRLRDLIVMKRFKECSYDGVLRLASQQGYCFQIVN